MLACGTAPRTPRKLVTHHATPVASLKSLVPQGFLARRHRRHIAATPNGPNRLKPLLRKENNRAFARESGSTARRHQQGIDRHAEGIGDALQVVQGDVSDLALAVRNKGAM
jgi:hypothetical protein